MNHTVGVRTDRRSRLSWVLGKLFPHRAAAEGRAGIYVGVFLLFSTIGLQVELVHDDPLNWGRAAASGAMAGTYAVMWLAIGTYRAWLLVPAGLAVHAFVLPTVFWLVGRSGILEYTVSHDRRSTLSALVTASIAMLAAGFGLIMRSVIRAVRRSQAARAELDVARQVHGFLVPPIDVSAPGVRVLARSRTSSTMGGDLIDVVQREGEVDVFLADVSGHGVKAGIVMAMLKSAVRTRLVSGGDLGAILRDVNRALAEMIEPSMFATMACVRVRPREGGAAVEYALAGHLPILHVCAGDRTVQDLENECLPLGIESGEPYAFGRMEASPGDVLVMLTDGLIEVQGKEGKELGLGRLREVIRAGESSSLDTLHDAVISRVDAHGAQLDDQTLALVRIESAQLAASK